MPEHFLAVISEREERPCPRVDLEPDNLAAANLFSLAISDHAGLTPLWFETLTDGMDAWERQAVLSRVVRTRPQSLDALRTVRSLTSWQPRPLCDHCRLMGSRVASRWKASQCPTGQSVRSAAAWLPLERIGRGRQ